MKNIHCGLQKPKLLSVVATLLIMQLCLPLASFAQFRERRDAANAALEAAAQAAAQAAANGNSLNLDLSSTARNISAANLNLTQNLNINVGGLQRMVSGSDLLTAAEFVAAHQVLSRGNQTLRLSSEGNAVGGRFSLNSSLTSSISNLVVPQNVKLHQDFAQLVNLTMTGNLTNAGKFVAFSSNPAMANAVINANNIYNQAGATLTTLTPLGSLPSGMNSAVSNMSLTLNALGEIVNLGTITSAGNLTMNAGNSIANLGTGATMQSAQNMNLMAQTMTNQGLVQSASGNLALLTASLVNSGTLQALTGNLSIEGLAKDLNVNNSSGLIAAANELAIHNLSELKANVNVSGGTLLASSLDFNSSDGHLSVKVDDLGGDVNVRAGTAAMGVSAGTHPFNIASWVVTGDPDLIINAPSFNDGGTGFDSMGGVVDITTTGTGVGDGITFTGNIVTTPTGTGDGGNVQMRSATFISTANITTSGNSGDGGNVQLEAATTIDTGAIDTQGNTYGNVLLRSGGDVTTVGNVTGHNISIEAGGDYTMGGDVAGQNAVFLSSGGTQGITQGAGTIFAPILWLTVSNGAGLGTSIDPLFLATEQLQVTSKVTLNLGTLAHGVYLVNNIGGTELSLSGNGAGAQGVFVLSTSGDLTIESGSTISGNSDGIEAAILLSSVGKITVEEGAAVAAFQGFSDTSGNVSSGKYVQLNTNNLEVNGTISGASIYINAGSDNLVVDECPTCNGHMYVTANSEGVGDGIISFDTTGDVNVHLNRMDGMASTSLADDITISVDEGGLYLGTINASGAVNLTHNSQYGDIVFDLFGGGSTTGNTITISTGTGGSLVVYTNYTLSAANGVEITVPYITNGGTIEDLDHVTMQNPNGTLSIGGNGTIDAPTINLDANGDLMALQKVFIGTLNASIPHGPTSSDNLLLIYSHDGAATLGTIDIPPQIVTNGGTINGPLQTINDPHGGVTYAFANSFHTVGNLLILNTTLPNDVFNPMNDTIFVSVGGVVDTGACSTCPISGNLYTGDVVILGMVGGQLLVHSTENNEITGNLSVQNTGRLYGTLGGEYGEITTVRNATWTGIGFTATAGGWTGGVTVTNPVVSLATATWTVHSGNEVVFNALGIGYPHVHIDHQTNGRFLLMAGTAISGYSELDTSNSVTISSIGRTDIMGQIKAGNLTMNVTNGDLTIDNAFAPCSTCPCFFCFSGVYEQLTINNGLNINVSNGNLLMTNGMKVNPFIDFTSCGLCLAPNIVTQILVNGNFTINNGSFLMVSDGSSLSVSGGSLVVSDAMLSNFATISNSAGNLLIQNSTIEDVRSLVHQNGDFTVDHSYITAPFNHDLDLSNTGGSMLVTNGSFLIASDSTGKDLNISNTGGTSLTLTNNSVLQASQGDIFITSGSDIYLTEGVTLGAMGPNFDDGSITIISQSGNVTIESETVNPAVAPYCYGCIPFYFNYGPQGPTINSSSTLLISATFNISITGPGVDDLYAPTGITLLSNLDEVQVDQITITAPIAGMSGGDFTVNTVTDLTVQTILANNIDNISDGDISLIVTNGNLSVVTGSTLSANMGDLYLQSLNGNIFVGADSFLTAIDNGSSDGNVYLLTGEDPGSYVAGSLPANFVAQTLNGGQIFYGASGITSNAPNNFGTADEGTIVFNRAGAGTITLDGNVIINSKGDGVYPSLLTSLDLENDAAVVEQILALQALGTVGGTLIESSGVAIGGNAILNPSVLAPWLTAENVPSGVTLTFDGFTSTDSLNLYLTGSSTTPQLTIAGTHEYTSSGSSVGTINITSSSLNPVVSITSTGILTSDNELYLGANGNIDVQGQVSAETLTLATTGRNGSINIGGTVTGNTSLSLIVSGTGTITSTVPITGANVYLQAELGDIGNSFAGLMMQADYISVTSQASVYLTQIGSTMLGNVAVGDPFTETVFQLKTTANGDILLDGNTIQAGTITLRADGSGGIFQTLNNVNFLSSEMSLYSTSGDIGGPNGPIGTTGTALLFVADGSDDGSFNAGTSGDIYLYYNGFNPLNVGDLSAGTVLELESVGGNIEVSGTVQADGSVTAANIAINAGFGNLVIDAGGTVQVTTEGSITITNEFTLVNNGLLSVPNGVGDAINVTGDTANPVNINGTGDIVGHLVITEPNHSVSINQNSITGLIDVVGPAGTSNAVNISVQQGNLTPGSILSGYSITLVAMGGNIVLNNSELMSDETVSLVSYVGSVTGTLATLGNIGSPIFSGNALYDFNVTHNGSDFGMQLGDIITNFGSITITNNNDFGIEVKANKVIYANEGNLSLINTTDTNATITILEGAELTASTTGTTLGKVFILVGNDNTEITSATPSNIVASELNGGQIYFGNSGDVIADPPDNFVTADGTNAKVVFNIGTRTAPGIIINDGGAGGVTITSQTGQTAPLITSLDLFNDPTAVATIQQLQDLHYVGGTLTDSGGVADGGNAIILPYLLDSSLTAFNIPSNVVITMANFTAPDDLNVSITGSSTTNQAIINGTFAFISNDGASAPNMVLTSTETGPAFVLGNGGQLTTDNAFSLTADGAISLAGILAGKNITFDNSANTTDGSISFTSDISLLHTGTGNGGNLSLLAGTSASVLNITTSGSGHGSGGNITIIAPSGITAGAIVTNGGGTSGDGGDIDIESANGGLEAYSLIAAFRGAGNGGDIEVDVAGDITISGEAVQTQAIYQDGATTGNGGNVALLAGGNIAISGPDESFGITTWSGPSGGNGGNITVNAGGTFTTGQISALSLSAVFAPDGIGGIGNAGNISITAEGDINAGSATWGIYASGGSTSGNGGVITITSNTGSANLGTVVASAGPTGDAGTVVITAETDLTMGEVHARNGQNGTPGSVTLQSNDGLLSYSFVLTNCAEADCGGGNITLLGFHGVTGGEINANGGLLTGDAGNIVVGANIGPLNISGLITAAAFTEGNGGSVNLSGIEINAVSISTIGGSVSGSGGYILAQANDGLNFSGFISSRARGDGNGNGIDLWAFNGNIVVGGIASSGYSLNSAGSPGAGGGFIRLWYGSNDAFVIDGAASSIDNGIKGPISTSAGGGGGGGDIQIKNFLGGIDLVLNDTIDLGDVGGFTFLNGYLELDSPISNSLTGAGEIANGSLKAFGPLTVNLTKPGSSLTISQVQVSNPGSVDVTMGPNTSSLIVDGSITVSDGNVTLNMQNTSTGTIDIAESSNIAAVSATPGSGNVYIVVGGVPITPTNTTAPANIVVSTPNGGHVYFGTNSITADPADNFVTADGATVIFDTNGAPATAIHLGGSVTINAEQSGSGPVLIVLDSLDLTDPDITSAILDNITNGFITGTLNVNMSGVATSGAITLGPSVLAATLTGENIPENVTVTLDGFGVGNPLQVNLTVASTTTQVIIAGTHEFTNSTGSVFTITSDQAGPVLIVEPTGLLSSNSSLDISANGAMTVSGDISAASLTINTPALTNNGQLTSTSSTLSVTSTADLEISGTGSMQALDNVITLQTTSASHAVRFMADVDQTFSVGNSGRVAVNSNNVEFEGNASLTINSPADRGYNSALDFSPVNASTDMIISMAGGATIDLTLPLSTNSGVSFGGYISSMTSNISFANSLGSGTATLNVGDNTLWVGANDLNITIGTGVKLMSDYWIQIDMTGSVAPVFTNNGQLEVSTGGIAEDIYIQGLGTADLVVNGTGTMTAPHIDFWSSDAGVSVQQTSLSGGVWLGGITDLSVTTTSGNLTLSNYVFPDWDPEFISTTGSITANAQGGTLIVAADTIIQAPQNVSLTGLSGISFDSDVTINNSGATTQLTATTGSIVVGAGSNFTASTLVLTTSGGNIGSPTQNIVTNAPTVTASTGGGANSSSVYITNTSASGLTFSGSNQAGTSGTFFVNATNNILTGVASSIAAGTVILNSASGSIGTSAASPLQLGGSSTTNLTASALTGSVHIASPTSIALQGNVVGTTTYANAALGTYSLASSGQITSSFSVGTNSATIPITGSPMEGISYNPSGTRVYVTHTSGASVDVIDTATNIILTSIPVGAGATGVTFSPDGTRAWVSNTAAGNVSVINTATNTVIATVTVGSGPRAVSFNPSGTIAYVGNFSSNTVSVVDTATNTVTATIPVGTNPAFIGINPSGTTLYVPNFGSNTVSVINTATNTVTATVTVGAVPGTVVVSPDGQFAYVGVAGTNTVAVISTATNTISTTIPSVAVPLHLAFNPSGTILYVANNGIPGRVTAVDTATNTVLSVMNLASNHTFGVAVSPAGTGAYAIIDHTNNPVYVFNIPVPTVTSGTVVLSAGAGGIGSASVPVYTQAANMTINSAGSAYLSNRGSVSLDASGAVHNTASGTMSIATTPDLTTGSGRITVNDTVTVSGGTINLQSSEGQFGTTNQGGIVQQPGASLVATNVNLNDSLFTNIAGVGAYVGSGSGTGTIGTTGQNILTTSSNLTARTGGDVYITNTGAVVVGTSFAGTASGTFSLTNSSSIQMASSATVRASAISITSSSSGAGVGSITQADALTTATLLAGTITLTANGTGSGGNSISLGTTNGTSPMTLTANSTSAVTIRNVGSVNLAGSSSAAASQAFTLTSVADTSGNATINFNNSSTVTAGLGGSVVMDAKAYTTGTSTTVRAISGTIDLNASAGAMALGTVNANGSGTGNGGSIELTATGTISTTGNVTANAATSGSTGTISMTSTGGDINTFLVESRALGTGTAAGDMTLNAFGNITSNGNRIRTLSRDANNPADLTIIAGGSLTASWLQTGAFNGDAPGTITVNTGGDVTISTWIFNSTCCTSGLPGGDVNITSGGNVSTALIQTVGGMVSGDINVNAAGSINVTGGIYSRPYSAGGTAGTITLIAGTNITTSTAADNGIDSSGNGVGNGAALIMQAGGNISTNNITTAATTAGANAGSMSVISTGGNISVTGAIVARSASGAGGNMILRAPTGTISVQGNDCGSCSAAVGVPLSTAGGGSGNAGNMTIQYSSAGAFIVDGTNHSMTNGVGGTISASAGSGTGGKITLINSGGDVNVTLNGVITAQSTSGTSGSVNLNYLQAGIGNPPTANAASNVIVTGSSSGQLLGTVFASGVSLDIDLPNAPIVLGNLTTTNGSASVVVNGDIVVAPDSTISVTEGDLLLQDLNTVDGAILVGDGSTLSATTAGSTFGNVYLVIGAVPGSPVYGWAPAYTFANQLNGGRVYFGTNGISDAPTQNTVTADGGNVIFNTDTLASSAIHLDGAVTINATAAPHGSTGTLGSLDLTDPSVTSLILSLIAGTEITGTLDVDVSGVATGGNITIAPSVLASTLSGYNIPENVTVNFQGFTSGDQITINLTGASYTTQAILSGTQEFSGGGVALMVITSNQAGPVLQINDTGSFTGDGGVSLAVGGNIVANGIVSSADNLTVRTVAGNGGIAIGANLAGTDLTILTAQGTGSISRTSTTTTTGVVSGTSVSLNSEAGSIGTGASNIQTATSTLTANTTTGSAFVANTGALNLSTSSVGNTLQVMNNNTITTTGAVNAGIVKLVTTANNGGIVVDSNVTGATSTNLTTQGTGTVTINSSRTVATTLGNVNVIAYGVDIQGAINSGTRSTQLRPNSNESISIANAGASAAPFEVSAAELTRITAGTLLIGDYGKNAPITLAGNIDVSGSGAGAYSLVFVSGGTYTPNASTIINLGTTKSLSVSTQGAASTGEVTGGTFINFSSAQAITVNDDVTVGTRGTIIVRGTSLNMTGTLNAPSGEIQLAPYGTRTIALGGNGGNAQFEVTNAFLANISAASLVVGDAMMSGGTTVVAGTDLSATNVSQFNLQNAGNITNAGTLTLGLKSMIMHAQGSVTSGTISGGSTVSLQAQSTLDVNGTITLTAGSVTLQGSAVNLTGSVNVGQGIVYFVPTSDVAISVGGASGSTPFAVTDSMLASVSAAAVAIGSLNVSGGLTVDANLNVSSSYNLYLLNAGAISTAGQTITVGSRTLGIQSGSTVTTGTISASGGQVTVLAGGTLTVGAAITNSSAGTVTLGTTAGSNGDVILNASVSGGNVATISANGSGDITQSTGTLSANTVALSSGTGNIGTSSDSLTVTATTLRANTAGTGTVFADVTSSSLTLGSSSAGGDFSVTSSGSMNVGNIATLNGDITLVANDALFVQANKTIFANEGNLVLQNTNTASGTIEIGLNSELEAFTISNPNKGNVTIFIGTVTPTPTNTTAPANVEVNAIGSGQAYFGANSIVALKPGSEDNVINAIDRNVVFDTGSRPASAITLDGNNVITADPPVQPTVSILPLDPAPDSLNMTNGVDLNPTSGSSGSGSSSSGSSGSGSTGSGSSGSGSSGSGSTGSGSSGSGSSGSGSSGSGSSGSGSSGSGSTGTGSSGSGSSGSGSTGTGSSGTGSSGTGSSGSGSTGSGSTGTTTGGRNGRNNSSTGTTTTTTTTGGRNGRNSGDTTGGTTGGTTTTTTTTGGRNGRNSGTSTDTTTTTTGGRNGRNSSTTTTTDSSSSTSTSTTGRRARTNVPVAFTPVTTTPGIFMVSVGTALVEYSPSTQVSAKEIGVVSLDYGEAMVIASDDTIVNIAGHQVSVEGGTIAHISLEDGVVKVRNLYEQSPGSTGVNAFVNGQQISTSAGTEIIISHDADTLTESVRRDSIGRRLMQSFDVGDAKVATCEISLVSLVPNSDLLPLVLHSKQKHDRAIADKLIKMAACLSTATSNHGPYKSAP